MSDTVDLSPETIAEGLRTALSDRSLHVKSAKKLGGGAIQENWLIELSGSATVDRLVLRLDAPSGVSSSASRRDEFTILSAVHDGGVKVPRPVAYFDAEDTPIGRNGFAMEAINGVAIGKKVVLDKSLDAARQSLADQLGRELAAIHSIQPTTELVDVIGPQPKHVLPDRLSGHRKALNALQHRSPALELASRWLDRRMPSPLEPVFVHGDYRTGNYMIDEAGLTGILDWEFSGWGDPREDIGWFCSADWRFGRNDLEAGGIGPRQAFYDGYCRSRPHNFEASDIGYFEVLAGLKWAIIALQQAERVTHGGERSLELALIGRRLPAIEANILSLLERAGGHLRAS